MPNTQHYNIFDYWKNKVITKDGMITNDTVFIPESIEIISDWDDPCCFACEKQVFRKSSDYDKVQGLEFKELWNHKHTKHLLNRCHIIPRTLGGKDRPGNLFLMCEECHFISPDTDRIDVFMRWVYDRRQKFMLGEYSPAYILSEVEKELKRRNLPDIETLLKNINGEQLDDFKDYLNKHTALHMTTLTFTTRISSMCNWLISNSLDVILRD